MGYNFSNIKSMSRDGKDIKNITRADGVIIWQKIYTWKKYEVVSTHSGYKLSFASPASISAPNSKTAGFYASYTFDDTTGEITLENDVYSQLSYSYWDKTQTSSYVATWWKGVRPADSAKYFISGGKYYRYEDGSPGSSTLTASLMTISETYTYSQGSYMEDVTSTNQNAYPTNGRSGSYWYVKQA